VEKGGERVSEDELTIPRVERGSARTLSRRALSPLVPYLLVLPAAVLAVVFIYGLVNGVLQGFGIMPYLGLKDLTLEYYRNAFTQPELLSSIGFSLYVAGVSSVLATVGGVFLSAVITRLRIGRTGRLVGIQVPVTTAHIIVALCVFALFGGSGLVARALFALGVIGAPSDFPSIAGSVQGWGIMLVYLWKEIPFVAFCTVTIMGGIGERYAEAASSLGASPLRAFFSVTLPLSASAIAKAFLIVFAFAFGAYEVPYLLGATLPRALPVLAYIQYTQPNLLSRADAMALNGVMTGITLVLAVAYFAIVLRERRAR
jgi:putative spermidine/putrescine transport system permease protein